MNYRHEWKHEINASDQIALRQRLRAVARLDPHTIQGKYEIRSLYFDSSTDRALREKLDGVNIDVGGLIGDAIGILSGLSI